MATLGPWMDLGNQALGCDPARHRCVACLNACVWMAQKVRGKKPRNAEKSTS